MLKLDGAVWGVVVAVEVEVAVAVMVLVETVVVPHSLSGVEMRKRQAGHIEGPPAVPGQPRPNTCCLCWNDDMIERSGRETCTKMDSIETTDEQLPSIEEMGSWARSFEMMMRSLEGREIFREFLRSEYSEENLLFWLACEELKKETDPAAVSLDSRVREGINLSLAEPSNLMYEEAQLQIYMLMHRDSFPRFLNSSVYRDLLATRRRTCLDT
ncbi:hypothetical protein CRUP_012892 [Coryphaenoides rupestris]|nr:hypothetical protein CRUP_012892 [Coryphaenoides rupestris]